MAIELNFQVHNKKRIAIMGGILVLLGIYTLGMSSSQTRDPYTAPVASNTGTNTSHSSVNAESYSTVTGSLEQAVNINPFIEMKEFDPQVNNITDITSTDSYENNTLPRARQSNIPLPVIPNYNPSNYQEKPLPSMPVGKPNVPPLPSTAPVTVQGIGTGDNGRNIAILSDGRVVSEGDTYNDGRISYIGGDGITFENGNKLQYK